MTTYFKAVRPDGGSFHYPSFQWSTEPGGVTKHPAPKLVGDNAATYLSVSTVPTDCTGLKWPCRLLEVEPVGDTFMPDAEEMPNKVAGVAFRTVRELPAHEVFGPQGAEVAALVERAGRLTPEEARQLAAVWDAAEAAAGDAAWAAARAAAGAAARAAAGAAVWDAAEAAAGDAAWAAARAAAGAAERDAAWAAAGAAAGAAARDAAGAAAGAAARDATWAAARDAAWAAAALVTRDLITEEQFNALYGPWAEVMEGGEQNA